MVINPDANLVRLSINVSGLIKWVWKKTYIYNYLEKHSCADCGNTNVMELEFDHFRDKSFNIGRAHIERRTLVELKREIKKCVVRCANCHTAKTHIEQNTWKHVMHQERNQK